MYRSIWRRLPEPLPLRLLTTFLLLAGLVTAQFGVVFPLLDWVLPMDDPGIVLVSR